MAVKCGKSAKVDEEDENQVKVQCKSVLRCKQGGSLAAGPVCKRLHVGTAGCRLLL